MYFLGSCSSESGSVPEVDWPSPEVLLEPLAGDPWSARPGHGQKSFEGEYVLTAYVTVYIVYIYIYTCMCSFICFVYTYIYENTCVCIYLNHISRLYYRLTRLYMRRFA